MNIADGARVQYSSDLLAEERRAQEAKLTNYAGSQRRREFIFLQHCLQERAQAGKSRRFGCDAKLLFGSEIGRAEEDTKNCANFGWWLGLVRVQCEPQSFKSFPHNEHTSSEC